MKSSTILIIDDDRDIAQLVEITLSGLGYNVQVAYDARQGMAMAFGNSPDLILLDFNLPGRDGLTLLKDIRAVPEMETVPVIMITGVGASQVVSQAILSKVTDFIVKPFTVELLVERVAKWLPPAPIN
jgi:two-component system chemotaxis response regulator CheY